MTAACRIAEYRASNSFHGVKGLQWLRDGHTGADARGFAGVGTGYIRPPRSASGAIRGSRSRTAAQTQTVERSEESSVEEEVASLAMAGTGHPAWMISTWSWRRRKMIA